MELHKRTSPWASNEPPLSHQGFVVSNIAGWSLTQITTKRQSNGCGNKAGSTWIIDPRPSDEFSTPVRSPHVPILTASLFPILLETLNTISRACSLGTSDDGPALNKKMISPASHERPYSKRFISIGNESFHLQDRCINNRVTIIPCSVTRSRHRIPTCK